MDFVRSYLGTNEKKWGQKCSFGQSFFCTKVTSYKIHILVLKSETLEKYQKK